MSPWVIWLAHCNKLHRYSITSAQPNSDSDFRLMDELDRGALDDRRKAFH
ncbi:hypothetical protein IVB18_11235 [Bradyrhizobium sp. 186]|nr:hypothetical protein [Bradyrhizobium sp. 186]UPK33123.1 hypothetical protein IVB18_33560 [Bradyrhizobium sp. 186]UPK37816.1 hypothetical protein IVB18_11235 [Bradyrhizobium sp. 186]